MITERTKVLQRRLERADVAANDRVQLLAISVDPDHDVPEVLRSFRTKSGVPSPQSSPIPWYHLTGASETVLELVAEGFRTAVGRPPEHGSETFDILHSSHFVLLDRKGQLRGYFRSDDEGMNALVRAVTHLIRSDLQQR